MVIYQILGVPFQMSYVNKKHCYSPGTVSCCLPQNQSWCKVSPAQGHVPVGNESILWCLGWLCLPLTLSDKFITMYLLQQSCCCDTLCFCHLYMNWIQRLVTQKAKSQSWPSASTVCGIKHFSYCLSVRVAWSSVLAYYQVYNILLNQITWMKLRNQDMFSCFLCT